MKNFKKQHGIGIAYVTAIIALLSLLSAYGFNQVRLAQNAKAAYDTKDKIIFQTEYLKRGITLCAVKYPNTTLGGPSNPSYPVSGAFNSITCPGAPVSANIISRDFLDYSFTTLSGFNSASFFHDATGMYAQFTITSATNQSARIVNLVAAHYGPNATFSDPILTIKL